MVSLFVFTFLKCCNRNKKARTGIDLSSLGIFTIKRIYFVKYCELIDLYSCTRRIVSANSGAIERVVTFLLLPL